MRALGELASCWVGVRAGEDAANTQALVDHDRRFDAVRDAREADVHQHEIGMLALGDVERFRSGRRETDAFDADRAQLQLAVDRNEVLVFDDQYAGCFGHWVGSSLWGELQPAPPGNVPSPRPLATLCERPLTRESPMRLRYCATVPCMGISSTTRRPSALKIHRRVAVQLVAQLPLQKLGAEATARGLAHAGAAELAPVEDQRGVPVAAGFESPTHIDVSGGHRQCPVFRSVRGELVEYKS